MFVWQLAQFLYYANPIKHKPNLLKRKILDSSCPLDQLMSFQVYRDQNEQK